MQNELNHTALINPILIAVQKNCEDMQDLLDELSYQLCDYELDEVNECIAEHYHNALKALDLLQAITVHNNYSYTKTLQ